ncbi:hypothetical protein C8Q74DRAFT_1442001, partial [Fomes fomentarius]
MKMNPIPSLFSPLHHLPNLDLDFDPSPIASLNPTLVPYDVAAAGTSPQMARPSPTSSKSSIRIGRCPSRGRLGCGLRLQIHALLSPASARATAGFRCILTHPISEVEERSGSWSGLDWVGYGVWALSVT